ncbi:MAG: GAF and ANTAR domain-containing protein [Actinomycetota bacterium]|nr:GAF and ANTAR domain-containing protein [Actinomycetota bacterium]
MATREVLLAQTFVELADTLVDDFDVIELLTMLSERCVELLGAAGTGILLGDQRGRLQVIAASSEAAQLLELFQLQNSEGPCLDCYRSGEPVVHPDLATANPWPAFGPVALAAGLPSVHAFPMRLRDQVVGTLNLFMAEARPLSAPDIAVAQALAHAASIAILQDHAARDSRTTVGQFQHALNSRVAIEQAKGVLSERAGITMDEAFARLRAHARSHNLKLSSLAASLVERTLPDDQMSSIVGTTGSDTTKRPNRPAVANSVQA